MWRIIVSKLKTFEINVCQQYRLQQKLRFLHAHDQSNNFLLQLGSNRLPTKQEQSFQRCIQIPNELMRQGRLIEPIFPDGLLEYEMT